MGIASASSTSRILGICDDKLLGHLAAVGLVAVIQLVAERGPRHVERADQRRRLLRLDDLQQVAREAVDGAHRLAARARQLRAVHGVEDLEDERVGVDGVDGPAAMSAVGRCAMHIRMAVAAASLAAARCAGCSAPQPGPCREASIGGTCAASGDASSARCSSDRLPHRDKRVEVPE